MEQIELNFNVAKEPQVLTVSEINKQIRENLESNYALLWMKGEISNFKAHSSGHFYFSLKDNKSQINAVMFRGFNQRLKFRPQDGVEVLVRGKITVYEPRGNYQIFCELMEPMGAGKLQLAFEQLKNKLAQEGLFDAARKRPLPIFPQHIAVVTSPTGAAIRDILNILHRRFRGLKITVVPALVQGEQATASIVQALYLAQQFSDIDAVIVGRGGGSLEDLWAFNTEPVARAIAACRVPIISAVGHEIDFTIADFVADVRAPTPSAAAELVVKNASEISRHLDQFLARLQNLITQVLKYKRQGLELHSRRLVDPRRRVSDMVQRLDELRLRLENAVLRGLADNRTQINLLHGRLGSPLDVVELKTEQLKLVENRLVAALRARLFHVHSRLQVAAGVLDSLSPLRVVERGYAIVRKQKTILRSIQNVNVGDEIAVRVADGEIFAQAQKVIGKGD